MACSIAEHFEKDDPTLDRLLSAARKQRGHKLMLVNQEDYRKLMQYRLEDIKATSIVIRPSSIIKSGRHKFIVIT